VYLTAEFTEKREYILAASDIVQLSNEGFLHLTATDQGSQSEGEGSACHYTGTACGKTNKTRLQRRGRQPSFIQCYGIRNERAQ